MELRCNNKDRVSRILGKRERERKAGTETHKIRCKGLFAPCFITDKAYKAA